MEFIKDFGFWNYTMGQATYYIGINGDDFTQFPVQINGLGEIKTTITKNTKLDQANIYFTPANFKPNKPRTKENFLSSIVVWLELDKDLPEDWEFEPTLIIQSSYGRYHVYWHLVEPIEDINYLEAINKYLASRYEGDSCFDATHYLRVPETLNFKYTPPQPVELIQYTPDRAYNGKEFLAIAEDFLSDSNYIASNSQVLPQETDERELNRALELIFSHRHFAEYADSIPVDRSKAIYLLVTYLLEKQVSVETIYFIIKDYLPNINKWVLSDRLLYKDIVNIFIKHGIIQSNKGTVLEAMYEKGIVTEQRKHNVAEIAKDILIKDGIFISTKNTKDMYYITGQGKLIIVDPTNNGWQHLISKTIQLYPSSEGSFFNYVTQNCQTLCREINIDEKIVGWTAPNRKSVYLFDQGSRVYNITKDSITTVINGSAPVLFRSFGDSIEPFTIGNIENEELLKLGKEKFDELFLSPNYMHSEHSEAYKLILKTWIIATLMGFDLLGESPLVFFYGDSNSGKSTVVENINSLLFKGNKLPSLPVDSRSDKREFVSVALKSPIMFWDNLDESLPRGFMDLLDLLVFNTSIEARKLYSTSETIIYRQFKSICITSNTMHRSLGQGTVQRAIPIHCKAFVGQKQVSKGSIEDEVFKHRTAIITYLVSVIQKILAKGFDLGKEGKKGIRLTAFFNLVKVISEVLEIPEVYEQSTDLIIKEQEKLYVSSDILVELAQTLLLMKQDGPLIKAEFYTLLDMILPKSVKKKLESYGITGPATLETALESSKNRLNRAGLDVEITEDCYQFSLLTDGEL